MQEDEVICKGERGERSTYVEHAKDASQAPEKYKIVY